ASPGSAVRADSHIANWIDGVAQRQFPPGEESDSHKGAEKRKWRKSSESIQVLHSACEEPQSNGAVSDHLQCCVPSGLLSGESRYLRSLERECPQQGRRSSRFYAGPQEGGQPDCRDSGQWR